MNQLHDRRKNSRIDLSTIDGFYRQCDIAVSSTTGDIDITILNISPVGMRIRVNSEEDRCKVKTGEELFIRGCIFSDNIGFLSSQKALIVWQEESICGIKFTPELEFDELCLRNMLK